MVGRHPGAAAAWLLAVERKAGKPQYAEHAGDDRTARRQRPRARARGRTLSVRSGCRTRQEMVAVEAEDARTRVNDGAADPRGDCGSARWTRPARASRSAASIASWRTGACAEYAAMCGCRTRSISRLTAGPSTGRIHERASSRRARTTSARVSWVRRASSHAMPRARRPTDHVSTRRVPCGSPWSVGQGWSAGLPDGTLDTVVELPMSRPTMPRLGGADGRTLFVTSQRRFLDAERLAREPLAGDLVMVRADLVGASPPRLVAI